MICRTQGERTKPCGGLRRPWWLGGPGKPSSGAVRPELSLPLPAPHRGVPSPKRMPSGRGGRDRFTAESYTVLGKEGRRQEDR